MPSIFQKSSFWLIVGLIAIFAILLQVLIGLDLAKDIYAKKVENSKPVIEIKTN